MLMIYSENQSFTNDIYHIQLANEIDHMRFNNVINHIRLNKSIMRFTKEINNYLLKTSIINDLLGNRSYEIH